MKRLLLAAVLTGLLLAATGGTASAGGTMGAERACTDRSDAVLRDGRDA